MTKTVLSVLAALAVGSMLADELSEQDLEDLKVIEREGGLLETTVDGEPIRIVSVQTRLSTNDIRNAFKPMRDALGLAFTVETAQSAPSMTGVSHGTVITIVDNPDQPSLLVAPESRYASINLAALASDNPVRAKLLLRFEKEAYRATGYAMGAAQSSFQPCIMRMITSLKELDQLRSQVPHPETQNKISEGSKMLGIGRYAVATYAGACAEGWAPAPTNDLQRSWYEKAFKPAKSKR